VHFVLICKHHGDGELRATADCADGDDGAELGFSVYAARHEPNSWDGDQRDRQVGCSTCCATADADADQGIVLCDCNAIVKPSDAAVSR
jgi:hypothetical protein